MQTVVCVRQGSTWGELAFVNRKEGIWGAGKWEKVIWGWGRLRYVPAGNITSLKANRPHFYLPDKILSHKALPT